MQNPPDDTAATMGNLKRLVGSLGVALATLACGNEDGSRVSFTFYEEQGFSADLLVVEFSDGWKGHRLIGADFGGTGGRRDAGAFPTRTAGRLLTSFWMIQGTDTLSSGELELDLIADWEWNISFFRSDRDPSLMCFGCLGSAAYGLESALQTMPGDSLWLVWGGNSISDPVVF